MPHLAHYAKVLNRVNIVPVDVAIMCFTQKKLHCYRHCILVSVLFGGFVLQHHYGLDHVVSLQLIPRSSALEPVSSQC